MSLERFRPTDRKAEADRSPLENDRTPTYTSNVTTAPTHSLSGCDFVRPLDYSLTDTLGVAETSEIATRNYVYYQIYAEDGAIPSKIPAAPGHPFVGRIKARSVPPPHTAKTVKRSIAKVEDIKDPTSTSLFLTPYSQSPMGDADKVTLLNRTSPGSTPQDPMALVAKMSDSERSALESGGRGELASAEHDSAPAETRYLYYLLYANDYEIPSKVAIDPEEPSLGRIRADSVAPPHSPASIKRCISRVERNPSLAHADLFADISCDAPLEEGHISIIRTDCPGPSPNKPMAIVQNEMPIVQTPIVPIAQEESPSFPDGRYVIKNRAADIYWKVDVFWRVMTIIFYPTTMSLVQMKNFYHLQWNITHDTNGNIFIRSQSNYSSNYSWAGDRLIGSSIPVPWRLIPADGKFYYLTTDMDRFSHKPRVPVTRQEHVSGIEATLKEGDPRQMWEFIRI